MPSFGDEITVAIDGARCDRCNKKLPVGTAVRIAYSQDMSCLGWWCSGCQDVAGDNEKSASNEPKED